MLVLDGLQEPCHHPGFLDFAQSLPLPSKSKVAKLSGASPHFPPASFVWDGESQSILAGGDLDEVQEPKLARKFCFPSGKLAGGKLKDCFATFDFEGGGKVSRRESSRGCFGLRPILAREV